MDSFVVVRKPSAIESTREFFRLIANEIGRLPQKDQRSKLRVTLNDACSSVTIDTERRLEDQAVHDRISLFVRECGSSVKLCVAIAQTKKCGRENPILSGGDDWSYLKTDLCTPRNKPFPRRTLTVLQEAIVGQLGQFLGR